MHTRQFATTCPQRRTSVLERPQPARCIDCHADSLSCPLTQLYIPMVPGRGCKGGPGSRGFATSRKHEKLDKRSGAVCQAYYCVQEVRAGQMAQGTPPLSARRGLPRWLQPASSTSPWFFYQVLSEVFSKSSSVMSSLLFL